MNENLPPLTTIEARDDSLVMMLLEERLLLTIQPRKVDLPLPISLARKKKKKTPAPKIMPKLTSSRNCKTRRSFLVADFETVLVNDVQQAYAAGFMEINPNDELTPSSINLVTSFFCKEPTEETSFEDLSYQLLTNFTRKLEVRASDSGSRTCYYHNLGRFDGLFLLYLFKLYL